MAKTLIKNTGIYFLINLLSQAAVFFLWIVIAKVLPPSEIGLYALVIFIVDFFGAFAIFGLNTAVMRFYYSEESSGSVFFNAFLIFIFSNILSFFTLSLSVGLILWLMPDLSKFLKEDILLLYLLVLTSSLYNFGLAHYSALRKVLSYAKISLSQTVLFLTFSLLLLYCHLGILGILYAFLISYMVSGFLFLRKEMKHFSFTLFSGTMIKSLLHYSVPMMLYVTFGTVVMYAGRIFLGRYTTLSNLGIYSFFLIIVLQINSLWATFNKAWTPELFLELKKDRKKALEGVKIITFFSSFTYLLFFAIVIIIKEMGFFNVLLKPIYVSNMNVLYILLMGPLFTGVYTAAYPLYYYEKRTKIILFISIIVNLIDIFLTFLMVKSFGEIGAALSYSISIALSMFAFLFAFKKTMQIPAAVIRWSFFIFLFAAFGIYLFLKTSSDIVLLLVVVLGIFLAYKYGEISKQKQFLFSFLKETKINL